MMRLLFFNLLTLLLLAGCQADVEKPSTSSNIEANTVVEASGELASSQTALISPPTVKNFWRYKITFLVPEGQKVKKGQPIIGFDTSQLSQNLSVKKSELNTAKKTFENTQLSNDATLEKQKLTLSEMMMKEDKAQRKWSNSKQLDKNIETKKLKINYLLAKNESSRLKQSIAITIKSNSINLAIAKNDVDRLQGDVDLIQLGINKMMVMSPKSGIVIYKPDGKGKKVVIGDSVWMARQILELPSLDNMIVKAKILEVDAGKIKLNQKVEVVLDASPEKIFKGVIKKLGQTFRRESRDQANIIFDAEVELKQIDPELMRPGMAARLKIFTTSVGSNQGVDKLTMNR